MTAPGIVRYASIPVLRVSAVNLPPRCGLPIEPVPRRRQPAMGRCGRRKGFVFVIRVRYTVAPGIHVPGFAFNLASVILADGPPRAEAISPPSVVEAPDKRNIQDGVACWKNWVPSPPM